MILTARAATTFDQSVSKHYTKSETKISIAVTGKGDWNPGEEVVGYKERYWWWRRKHDFPGGETQEGTI